MGQGYCTIRERQAIFKYNLLFSVCCLLHGWIARTKKKEKGFCPRDNARLEFQDLWVRFKKCVELLSPYTHSHPGPPESEKVSVDKKKPWKPTSPTPAPRRPWTFQVTKRNNALNGRFKETLIQNISSALSLPLAASHELIPAPLPFFSSFLFKITFFFSRFHPHSTTTYRFL